ncbi:MAG: hypothetical protein QOH96_998 [Blastocatellia bacterium]|nr:hypothetical protein [Blastocatellia bacterium]
MDRQVVTVEFNFSWYGIKLLVRITLAMPSLDIRYL